MSQYIKGRQIPVASGVARKVGDLKMKVVELRDELRQAGLGADANELDSVREHLYEISSKLERKARDAYCAARRGEELPK
jgi:hypothetical protein